MKHLFVPYELALLAKNIKLNSEDIFGVFNKASGNFYCRHEIDEIDMFNGLESGRLIIAPLYQQLVDWFREVKSLEVVVLSNTHTTCNSTKWEYSIYSLSNKKIVIHPVLNISNYYEALNAALTEAFKLIQLWKTSI